MWIIPDNMQVDQMRDNSTGEEYCEVNGTPIEISKDGLDEIVTDWIKIGGHKKSLVLGENGKWNYKQDMPFSTYLNILIALSPQV